MPHSLYVDLSGQWKRMMSTCVLPKAPRLLCVVMMISIAAAFTPNSSSPTSSSSSSVAPTSTTPSYARRGYASRIDSMTLADFMNGPVLLKSSALPVLERPKSALLEDDERQQLLLQQSNNDVPTTATAIATAGTQLDKSMPSKHAVAKNGEKEEEVPRTMPGAIRRFFFGKDYGPILVVCSIAYLAHSRFVLPLAPLSLSDSVIFATSVVLWWFQEHFMHLHLLHSNFDWLGKRIHQAHHERHYFHVSIDSPELIMGWLWTVHLLLRATLPLPLALSATVGYACAGLFYEWSHFIVHTRYKPRKNGLLSRMRDNHIRHHRINDSFWLAFSVPQIDDIFGTNPTVEEARARKNRL